MFKCWRFGNRKEAPIRIQKCLTVQNIHLLWVYFKNNIFPWVNTSGQMVTGFVNECSCRSVSMKASAKWREDWHQPDTITATKHRQIYWRIQPLKWNKVWGQTFVYWNMLVLDTSENVQIFVPTLHYSPEYLEKKGLSIWSEFI